MAARKKKADEPAVVVAEPKIVKPEDIPTLEQMVESQIPNGREAMTPVQRAACRVADGLPLGELWDVEDVQKALGGKRPPEVRPRLLLFLSATRGAKSLFGGALAIRRAFEADLSGCSPGDEIRLPCLATGRDQAGYIYKHALSILRRTPALADSLAGRPLTESFRIRRENGFEIIVTTLAMSAKGNNIVGSWLASIIFDEAPRMGTEEETVRSINAAHDACADRILRMGQEVLIGAPDEPHGMAFEYWEEHFGHPSAEVCVINANGPMLNPKHWTPEFMRFLARTNVRAYVTSGLGKFADAENALIPSASIRACMTTFAKHPRRYIGEDGKVLPEDAPKGARRTPCEYTATIGPGERGAAWTFVILTAVGRDDDGQILYEEGVAMQFADTATEPLVPREVMREVKKLMEEYEVPFLYVKDTFVQGLLDLADALGIMLSGIQVELLERVQFSLTMRAVIVERRIALTSSRQQCTDLQRVKKKPTVSGTTVQFPTSGGDNACDFAPVLGVCLLMVPDPPTLTVDVHRDPLDEFFEEQINKDPFEAVLGG